MWNDPRAMTAAANLLFAVALGMLGWAAFAGAARHPAFAIREVLAAAAPERTTREQIEAVVASELRGTFFTVNLERLKRAFEKLPWVRRAELRRRWPMGIEVRLEEHVVLARWGSSGLVNAQGEVFDAAWGGPLPLLAGPEGSAPEVVSRYREFKAALAAIGHVPVRVTLTERRAWTIESAEGLTLKLGREQVGERLARFVAAYGESRARLEVPPRHLDLRYDNGFAVRAPVIN